jgi:TetR/AcrR family transcriptional regulator, regulator of mycofactocin system
MSAAVVKWWQSLTSILDRASLLVVVTERLRDRKREETRRRLVEAGHRMIRERGYTETTTADIAEAAGVTERTFFRHFESKGEIVVANWRRRCDAFGEAVRAAPDSHPPLEVVRAAFFAFTQDFTPDDESSRANARTIWANHPLVLLLLDVVIELETDLARELARRLGRSANDLDVRIAANASIGVLRASIRGAFVSERHDNLADSLEIGLDRIAPVFPTSRLGARFPRRWPALTPDALADLAGAAGHVD